MNQNRWGLYSCYEDRCLDMEREDRMNEPTQEQKTEFLEWCGARIHTECFTFDMGEGSFSIAFWIPTLDFLFKHAVPKLGDTEIRFIRSYVGTAVKIDDKSTPKLEEFYGDPALALLWAIDKARKEEVK